MQKRHHTTSRMSDEDDTGLNSNKKILIIDDEAYIRRVLELKFKKRGYQVFTAANGDEGLKRFKTHQPNAVITDINMPILDGKAFCERTNDFKKERPFLTIIVTCSLSFGSWEWVDKMNDTVLFEKPFSPSKILDCVDQYFDIQR